MSKCKICDYSEREVTIINELCSVHTCEICKKEGYATELEGKILCDECHIAETTKGISAE